mmetsp:Transcript_25461/g.33247  ORF Transcript_25461/g.33247 Transcript_25461/m.33247 type:complete len:167 (+) Transcript_25461:115-615(+)|eukprot:CAMPEP_0117760420 /NCGR_PEP_ID=MMETSP0947-20121206/16617_1 /TAXON_ID=44440 /ORGANISM="Chattonella subsalsa, Strain CCMP2191" /LENGTH=166 /DNA_ID=CAMNT_0005581103 /DNA_START=99 /DNA_END=599 /DNA_ORIENTATION=-
MNISQKLFRFFALLLFASCLILVSAEDSNECEVCVKVLNDVDELLTKSDKKNKAKIENAIDTHCSKKALSQREKKMCYNLEPIKRSVSQPFSIGMPKLKVCQRLKKDNPDICDIKFPLKMAADTDYSKLRVKQLKQILADRGVACEGCLEKSDYVKQAQATAHLDL